MEGPEPVPSCMGRRPCRGMPLPRNPARSSTCLPSVQRISIYIYRHRAWLRPSKHHAVSAGLGGLVVRLRGAAGPRLFGWG